MSHTIPRIPNDRHLASVDGTSGLVEAASAVEKQLAEVTELAVQYAVSRSAKPVLRPLALLDVAQAEEFVIHLYARIKAADDVTLACLIGESSRHLQKMIDLIRAVTELPR